MIEKNKILRAVSEGILAGFKFSSNLTANNSSDIDFNDAKIKTAKSLTTDVINEHFKIFIDNENWEEILNYVNIYGTEMLTDRYIVDSYDLLKNLISMLIDNFGPSVNLNWIRFSSKITNLENLFLSNIDLKGESVYDKWHNLKLFNGDISEWDVSNIQKMESMFERCDFNGDISKWDVSNVNHMEYMFAKSRFNQDISNWNVSNVIDMSYMFCESIFNRDISNWNVSNVISMEGMFIYSLFNSDIANWNISNVNNMKFMFEHSLFNKDVSNWDISNIKTIKMFEDCPILNENKPYNCK